MGRGLYTAAVYADKVIGVGREEMVFSRGSWLRDPQTGARMSSIQGHKVKSKGYVVFHCPVCGKRNKRAGAEAEEIKGKTGETFMLAWSCNGCGKLVPVRPPAANLIVGPDGKMPGADPKPRAGGIITP
jgi:predicted RNA-binding Zn-ribbon protein involved in translation (DUF1610 family)